MTIMLESDSGGAIDASTLVNASIDGIKKTMKNPKNEILSPREMATAGWSAGFSHNERS